MSDNVNHPSHYTSHPSGVECIEIAEHMNFCLGNAFKYVFRRNLKDSAEADLRKARWYIDREIDRLDRIEQSWQEEHVAGATTPRIAELLANEPDPNVREIFGALWRAGLKGDAVEDLKKARWYLDREIARVREKQ